ncbi:glucans biosynthesis glucosyltransferase MdoH [Marinobacter sp.]|uniref:glucans biosynthesis glucosyltransferase MdoH n=1 Tax=Marinobacter sp. TaxID=50741 RepID=UPI000C56E07B|nr:glucans biosynthesis glucosyltransferase MdoH [Marinobacter sp.]MAO11763.1 glucans biosynthesis glucosyltransferase MdoH [Marinobacter sp.]
MAHPEQKCRTWRLRAAVRRCALILLVGGQTLIAGNLLLQVLPYHGGTPVEVGIVLLFALLYVWISFGFWMAVYGFVLRLLGGDRHSLINRHSSPEIDAAPLSRTAVVMPIYHEPVRWTLEGLKAMYRDLERSGELDQFDFFILSDSQDPEVWLEEQAAWYRLVTELGAEGRIFYRRRRVNLNFKSGNVADFLRRWGRGYEYMVVLDADSLLAGDTIRKMVRLMNLEPRVGILQSAPTVINGQSAFARIQQFASRLYSPLFATGLAAIQMGDAVFWGHNAIIRVAPFMSHCGLRKLSGFGIWRGPIMSHDFVEAAFLGRAGYEVWLEPTLAHSYEESPPTLDDELARDQRWSKGNLQHAFLMLLAPKLRMAHRLAFLNGIMAYAASPLWLAFLVLTTIAAVQLTLAPIDYFPDGHESLFPLWPEWRPEWAILLVTSTLALLFLPKFLAVADVVLKGELRRYGGGARLLISVFLEIMVSVLLAPIRMLAHSRFVVSALLNLRLGWAAQNRTEEIRWRDALVQHLPGFLVGGGWSLFAMALDPMFFYWSLPVSVPLILAAPTTVWLSRISKGEALGRYHLLQIPDTLTPIPLLEDARKLRERLSVDQELKPLERAIIVPPANRLHRHLARPKARGAKRASIDAAVEQCVKSGYPTMDKKALSLALEDAQALADLHKCAWNAPVSSFWGARVQAFVERRLNQTVDNTT